MRSRALFRVYWAGQLKSEARLSSYLASAVFLVFSRAKIVVRPPVVGLALFCSGRHMLGFPAAALARLETGENARSFLLPVVEGNYGE